MSEQQPLLEVRNLTKYFPIRKGLFGRVAGHVKAVDDVSFDVFPHETVGLVGESGCGKTTAGRSLLRLIEPTSGEAIFEGADLFQLSQNELRPYRRNLQIIFQDPYSSLNPRMTVENLIGEAMVLHGLATQADVREQVKELLEKVGLQPSYVSRYPHEFSGGQRQRIGIARALALRPRFIVCDEAVSALDVSVQAQVINLLLDLKEEFGLSYLFIAHDLSVVKHISDRIAVMYLGRMVEMGASDAVFRSPAHPYTQALLSAIPEANPRRVKERIILRGDVPTPINPPSGCRFHTRCPAAFARCRQEVPELREVAPGHRVACHLYTEGETTGLTLAEAQRIVATRVLDNADTVLTNARRHGLDPKAKLRDIELPASARGPVDAPEAPVAPLTPPEPAVDAPVSSPSVPGEAAQSEAAQSQAAQSEPAQSEPAQSEPAQSEPAQSEAPATPNGPDTDSDAT